MIFDEKDTEKRIERTVIGAMILDGLALDDATQALEVDDFSLHSHREVYRAILAIAQDGGALDYNTIAHQLAKRKSLQSVGGIAYLCGLTEGVPPFIPTEYIAIIKNKSLERQALGILHKGMERIAEGSEDPRALISDIEGSLQSVIAETHEQKSLPQQVNAMMEGIMRRRSGEAKTFVTSGLEDIDDTHGGFALGEVTVIGAWPGAGKSSLLRMAIRANCKRGDYCHLMTPEMLTEQVLQIFVAQETKIPFRRIRHAERLTEANIADIRAANREIEKWPLTIDDRSPLTPAEMVSRARSVRRVHGTKLFGLDYLQKLNFPGKVAERYTHITDAMVSMTQLAKNEKVAVVVISSLTEPGGKEKGRMPRISDFRGSGDIQYEANTAILLHRELDEKAEQMVRETSFIYGKARSDQSGVKKAYFNPDFINFESQESYLEGLGK